MLLIDTDPQGNLWTTLNAQEQFQSGQPRGWVHQLFEDNPVAAMQIATPVHEKVSSYSVTGACLWLNPGWLRFRRRR